MAVDPLTGGAGGIGPRTFVRYRKSQCRGMQNALQVIEDVHAEWAARFGRRHAPLVEEYRLDDAKYALVTIGSMTGAAKNAVDAARERGDAVGLIKLKTFRPFPLRAMVHALAKVAGRRRGRSRGRRSAGTAGRCSRRLSARCTAPRNAAVAGPAVSFIGGLSGADITEEHFARAIDTHGAGAWRAIGPTDRCGSTRTIEAPSWPHSEYLIVGSQPRGAGSGDRNPPAGRAAAASPC